jgi:hypothetical protein
MDFSNREIATGIIIAAALILMLVFPKTRRALFSGIVDVPNSLFKWKLLLLLALYFLYAIGLVALAESQGWWDVTLLSVTILAIIVTGFPLFMNANNYTTGSELTRKVVFEVAGVTALMITYLNLGEFPIWGEVILQLTLIPIVIFIAMAPRTPEGKRAARFFEILLGILAIGLIISTTVTLFTEAKSFDWLHEFKTFALSIWLPVALIPFLYVLALFMQIEMALVRMKMHCDRNHPPLRVRLALVVGFHWRLIYAKRFSGLWITEMAEQRTFRDGRAFMRKYRKAVQARLAEQRAHGQRVKERTGLRGFDEQGLWLDRREFYETREILDDMWFTQAAIFRNGKKYVNEPFLISSFHLKKLPKDHGIEIVLAKNARAWYAWRKTSGGYVFATGGSKDVDAKWRYDGTETPACFPHSGIEGWINTTLSDKSAEWETSQDQPIPLV